MRVYRAAWILPIAAPPIRDGWVAVEQGVVADLGTGTQPGAIDLGDAVVLPALVNAHTHLELSHLRGVVPPADRFLDWIRGVMAARGTQPDAHAPAVLAAARVAISAARASGTGVMGDISNTLATVPLLEEAGMPARVFYELLGFNVDDPVDRVGRARTEADRAQRHATGIRISLAPHAPYSVSPALFRAIREDLDAHAADRSSVHLAESPDEVEFIEHGTGGWPELLRAVGAWADAWRPAGRSPVRYLSDLGFLDSRVLAVHGVQCSGDDLTVLKALGTTVVSCPRSNRYVGVGDPPIESFYAVGVPVALGTDSLASVEDLNMFAELAAARRLAPRVPARDLLESATLRGARALGFGAQFGSIEAGKRAALIAVRVPGRVDDVEEYLLSGIEPAVVAWLDPDNPKSQ